MTLEGQLHDWMNDGGRFLDHLDADQQRVIQPAELVVSQRSKLGWRRS
jgi:hypothetical protein